MDLSEVKSRIIESTINLEAAQYEMNSSNHENIFDERLKKFLAASFCTVREILVAIDIVLDEHGTLKNNSEDVCELYELNGPGFSSITDFINSNPEP